MLTPTSTYRLQITSQQDLSRAAELVPYLKRQGLLKFKEMTAKRSGTGLQPSANAEDPPDEKEFLDRVRSEAAHRRPVVRVRPEVLYTFPLQ